MSIFDSLILGLLQGITEFLPISSSGHLVLGEHYLSLNVDGLKSFDVAVHLATLLAVFVYFWKDILGMLKALLRLIIGKLDKSDPYVKLIFYILIGSIPAMIFGLLCEEWIDAIFRNVRYVALMMFVVGIIYLFGELVYKKGKIQEMKWYKAVFIGIAQAVAIVPGISRSGSTIVAGLFQGIERKEAARFSFLLGIPAILGAGFLTALKIPGNGGVGVDLLPLFIGFISAFVFGILSISFLMMFLKKNSLMVFAVYLIALGSIVFI
ncbi:MAG: undecaprenyl-diphosphatase UppP [Candidatus Gracilibacteria bacterium]|jgi:undecaprenyl-diphosphatase